MTDLITDALVEQVIQAESGRNPHAVSPVGARGLMQLMAPAWADVQQAVPDLAGFGYEDYWKDAGINRRFGTEYLGLTAKRLPAEYRTVPHLLAAYNWGIGNLKKANYDLSKAPRETKAYIRRITGKAP
jgi:soluble lytic murein transglycosylase-like protein